MRQMHLSKWLCVTAVLLCASPAHAAIAFDTASDMSLFNRNGGAITSHNWNATAGVGGGGGVSSTSSSYESDAMILPTSIANIIGAMFFVQLDYHMQFQGSGPDVRVGFATSATGSFNSGTPTSAWIETYGSNNPKNFVNSEPPATFVPFPNVTMTPLNWFRLRLSMTKATPTDYNATAQLWDLGPTGLSAPTLLSNQPYTMSSVGVGAAPQLFAGFHVWGATLGADNFDASAIPEPTAAFALALLAAPALSRRRRVIIA